MKIYGHYYTNNRNTKKWCFVVETLKGGRGSTPKMAEKSAVRKANWMNQWMIS
jgi:hypothetical protein